MCPSRWAEAAGLVNLEASAAGLPVVASRIGGLPEHVRDGLTGYLFSPDDHDELAGFVQTLLENSAFFAYSDPGLRLQREDLEYNRYHPLQLNAAFLGNLTEEDRRILGFGNRSNFQPGYEGATGHPYYQAFLGRCYDTKLFLRDYQQRLAGKLRRLTGLNS